MNSMIPKFESVDQAVDFGNLIREKTDGIQWVWGDFAISVEKSLGPVLEEVSKQIGIAVRTMKRCRDVAKKYPEAVRGKYPKLSWTHYKHAAGQNDPEHWLKSADEGNWSVELMKMQIKTGGHLPPYEQKPKMIQCLDNRCNGYFLIGSGICPAQGNH